MILKPFFLQQAFKEQIFSLQQDHVSLRAQLDSSMGAIKALGTAQKDQTEAVAALQEEIEEGSADTQSAMEMVKEVKSEQAKRRYSGKLEIMTTQLENLSNQVEQKAESVHQIAIEMQGHNESQSKVQLEIASMKSTLADIHDNPLCITPRELSPRTAASNDLSIKIKELQQAHDQAQSQMRGGVEQVEEQVSSLREQLLDLSEQVASQGRNQVDLISSLEEEIQIIKKEKQNPPQAPAGDDNSLSVNEMKIKKIQVQVDQIVSQVGSHSDNLSETTTRIDGLEDQLSAFEEKFDGAQDQIESKLQQNMQTSSLDEKVRLCSCIFGSLYQSDLSSQRPLSWH